MGGGGSKQSTLNDVATSIASSVLAENLQSCVTVGDAVQEICVNGASGNVNISGNSMSLSLKINVNCQQSQQQITNIQNAITNQLSSEATQKNEALLGAFNSLAKEKNFNDTKSYIKSAVSNSVTSKMVNELLNKLAAKQSICVNDSSGNININNNKMALAMDAVASAAQSMLQDTQLATDLKAKSDVVASQVQANPISEAIDSVGGVIGQIGSIISSTYSMLFGMVILVIVIVAVIAMFVLRGVRLDQPLCNNPILKFVAFPFCASETLKRVGGNFACAIGSIGSS